MASLLLSKHARKMGLMQEPAMLYKKIVREIPRILTIYDIEMPIDQVKEAVRSHFYEYKDIKDPRVIEMLVEQGYFSLETTMLQHKQKSHLMRYLEGYTIPMEGERKRLTADSTIDEQFARD
eukprot:CAMPEP_0117045434 /NCGR_PEP_ID=MMETSP0472-20121206/31436_1 /TAXON_ID=693140 ORGANISM="Tiarina fusus, Strain LIS" /NCGR_SAMPLE_ID=MMETSP0472 /ASSEMBLY_ACC=CAM_ASM_000603 /LENGTH=121 /DNA_ID=CAMNT_0004757443 /DNA_START=27 /DNA_END=392 /DNA_ORIENTATION=+